MCALRLLKPGKICSSLRCIATLFVILVNLCHQSGNFTEAASSGVGVVQYTPIGATTAKSLGSKAVTLWWWLGAFEWPSRDRSWRLQLSQHYGYPQSGVDLEKANTPQQTGNGLLRYLRGSSSATVNNKQKSSEAGFWRGAQEFIDLVDKKDSEVPFGINFKRSNLASGTQYTLTPSYNQTHESLLNNDVNKVSLQASEDVATAIEMSKKYDKIDRKEKEISKTDHGLESLWSQQSVWDRPKKAICCNTDGICRTCLEDMDAEEVVNHYFRFFSDVPNSLISFSKHGLSQNTHCDNLSVVLFPVDLENEVVSPAWLRFVDIAGWCPSILVHRSLGSHAFPSKIVEAECLCEGRTCSKRGAGFQCVSVYRTVTTWIRHDKGTNAEKPYTPKLLEVRVGCVCAQRSAAYAGAMDSFYARN